ncbi:unnamed protein product, partial [Allacma fusca]
ILKEFQSTSSPTLHTEFTYFEDIRSQHPNSKTLYRNRMASPLLQPSVLTKVAIMESCANCSFVFTSSSSRTKAVELVIEASQSGGSSPGKVAVGDAFAFIQNMTREDDMVVPICSDCAPPLTRAYVEVKKLSQLRATDSYFAQQLRLSQDLKGGSLGSKKGAKRRLGKNKGPKTQAKKAIVSSKGKGLEAKEKTNNDSKKPPSRAKIVFDSLSSSNIINGPSSELSRPSRSAKLTAMVLMASSWDKEPLVFEENKKPARTSQPASTTTKSNWLKSEESFGKPSGKPEKGPTKRKAPTPPTLTKKPKLETVTEDLDAVSWKLNKKKLKKAALVNVSKATSISPPSRSKPSKGQDKESTSMTSLSDQRVIPESVSVPKLEPVVQHKPKKIKKGGKVTEEFVQAKVDIANVISKKDSKSDKKTKISKAKVLLPKVFKKLNTESAVDRKKLKGAKMIVTDDPVVNPVTGSDQALDLTLKMSPTLSNDLHKSSKKSEKLKLPKPNKALNSVETIGSVKSNAKKPPISTEQLSHAKAGKIKEKTKLKEDKNSVDDAKGKKFLCNSCDKTFSARWNLRRHELLVHELASSSPPFNCPNCSQLFEVKQSFFEHRMSGPCATSTVVSPTQNKPPVVSIRPSIPQVTKKSQDPEKDIPKPKPKEIPDGKKAAKRKVPEKSPTPTKVPKDSTDTGNSANSSPDTSSGSQKTKQDAINQLFDSVKAAAEAKNSLKPEVQAVETTSTSGATHESNSKDAKSSDQPATSAESSEKSAASPVSSSSVNNNASSSAGAGNNSSGPAENPNGAGVGA